MQLTNIFLPFGNIHETLTPTTRAIYDYIKGLEARYLSAAKKPADFLMSWGGLVENYDHPLSKMAFYAAFVTLTHGAHKLAKLYLVADPIAYLAPAIFGAILQGRPDCPAQIRIESNPAIAGFAGAINGLMCCVGYSLVTGSFEQNPALWAASSMLFVAFAAKSMCAIESKIGASLLREPAPKPHCCCGK